MNADRRRVTAAVPAGHAALVLAPGDIHWAMVAAWTRAGLARGEKVIFSGMPLGASDPLLTSMELDGVDVGAALDSSQLAFEELTALYPDDGADGQEPLVTAALAEGYPGVRISVPAQQALTRMSADEFGLVEARLDELCRRYPLSALCQYDAALVAQVTGSVTTHPIVSDDMGLVATVVGPGTPPGTARLEVSGEFDSGNAALLEQALVRAGGVHGALARIELDLAGLRFLSVAAGRALLDGTAAYRGNGGSVLIRGADLHLTQVLALLTMADHAGIEVEGM